MEFSSLRIASMNVQDFGRDGDEIERCKQIADLWSKNPFDVLFVYEVWRTKDAIEQLVRALTKKSRVLWGFMFQENNAMDARHVGFVFRRDLAPSPQRVEWTSTEFIRNHPLNQGRGRPYGLHRIIMVKVGALVLIGVHLKSLLDFRHKAGELTAQQKRDLQVAMITDWLERHPNDPVVLAGDFNSNDSHTCAVGANPDTDACNRTTEPLYNYLTHLASTNVVPTWRGTKRYTPTNLDHVFVSKRLVENWDLRVVDAVGISDHNMLSLIPRFKCKIKPLSLVHRERTQGHVTEHR